MNREEFINKWITQFDKISYKVVILFITIFIIGILIEWILLQIRIYKNRKK